MFSQQTISRLHRVLRVRQYDEERDVWLFLLFFSSLILVGPSLPSEGCPQGRCRCIHLELPRVVGQVFKKEIWAWGDGPVGQMLAMHM